MSSLLMIILLFVACESNDGVRLYRIQKTPPPLDDFQQPTVSDENMKWDTPSNWSISSSTKMRLASYNIPFSNGYGDLSIMILAGDGGGVQANVNRWRSQIGLGPQSLNDINKASEERSNDLGTYQIFYIINSQKMDKAFICAVMPSGLNTTFVKLSIESKGINEVKNDFISFCDSFRLEDE